MIFSLICLIVIQHVSSGEINHLSSDDSLNIDKMQTNILIGIYRIRDLSINVHKPFFHLQFQIDSKQYIVNFPLEGPDAYWECSWPAATITVDYDQETPIPIDISLYYSSSSDGRKKICDISNTNRYNLSIQYDVKRGEWIGDDFLKDETGYGHSSGFEDENKLENDCEIWFDIKQGKPGEDPEMSWYSDDRLTPWEILNLYDINMSDDHSKTDFDNDLIPTSWEDKYGYDPFIFEDHKHLDADNDGLNNFEEWKTNHWFSDPFAQDIFLEVDWMKSKYHFLKDYRLSKRSQQLLMTTFTKEKITLHIDDGWMGGGGDSIPYDKSLTIKDIEGIRMKYFFQGDPENWKKGVFRYAIMGSQIELESMDYIAGGISIYFDTIGIGVHYIKTHFMCLLHSRFDSDISIASGLMHELGHTLGITPLNTPGCDKSGNPFHKDFWIYGNYYSAMNFRYVYNLIDFSHGNNGENDWDDWSNLDLTLINKA